MASPLPEGPVTCPNCGFDAAASDERCPGCSLPLHVTCPDCGTHVRSDADECPACGESLAHASEAG